MKRSTAASPARVTAKYDIVGSLPLELVIQVVKYLNHKDVIRAQRVSKRWRTILSCDTIIKLLLPETLAFLGLYVEGVSTDTLIADATSYFRWRHGLEHARPVKGFFLPWSKHMRRVPHKIQCHSRRLFYVNNKESPRAVQMLNLETGEISKWRCRGRVDHIVQSDQYLVISSTNGDEQILTAWDIHENQIRILRYERWPFYVATLCSIIKKNVVIAPGSGSRLDCPVMVWDLSSNHVHKIGNFSRGVLYHLDTTENVLVTFEITWWKSPPEVKQTKWTTTTGHLLEKKVFPLAITLNFSTDQLYESSRTYGHKTVTQVLFTSYYHKKPRKWAVAHLEYDYATDRLSARWIDLTEPAYGNTQDRSVYLTQNLVYRHIKKGPQVVVYNTSTDVTSVHSDQLRNTSVIRVHGPSSSQRVRREEDQYPFVFGDREVFGFANSSGIQLWFFNPNFVPSRQIMERVVDSFH